MSRAERENPDPGFNDLEMFGALYARLIHDLNNSVGSLSAGVDQAASQLGNPDEAAKALDAVRRAMRDLERLAQRFTEIAYAYPLTLGSCESASAAATVRDVFAGFPEWSLEGKLEFGAGLPMSERWLALALEEIVGHCAKKGRASVSVASERRILRRNQNAPMTLPSDISNWFLALQFESDAPPVSQRDLVKDGTVAQIMGFQVLRLAGGWFQSVELEGRGRQALVTVPMRKGGQRK